MQMLYFDWMISVYLFFFNSLCLILTTGDYTYLIVIVKIMLIVNNKICLCYFNTVIQPLGSSCRGDIC